MTMDPNKIAEAAAKMRRPELRLNPADVERMTTALRPPSILGHDPEWVPGGIAIIADATVEPGHMWLVDAAPEPPTFILPEPFDPDVLAALVSMRDRWTTIGMDLGYSPSIATIATFEDGRCVDVHPADRIDPGEFWSDRARSKIGAMFGLGLAAAARMTAARRPWKLTGRKATRVRWRRMGRR
jgi:hypothetical protein